MIDTAFARYNIYDIGVSPLSHIFYIEPGAKAYGMFTCAPLGAEGATHRERRGQIMQSYIIENKLINNDPTITYFI